MLQLMPTFYAVHIILLLYSVVKLMLCFLNFAYIWRIDKGLVFILLLLLSPILLMTQNNLIIFYSTANWISFYLHSTYCVIEENFRYMYFIAQRGVIHDPSCMVGCVVQW